MPTTTRSSEMDSAVDEIMQVFRAEIAALKAEHAWEKLVWREHTRNHRAEMAALNDSITRLRAARRMDAENSGNLHELRLAYLERIKELNALCARRGWGWRDELRRIVDRGLADVRRHR